MTIHRTFADAVTQNLSADEALGEGAFENPFRSKGAARSAGGPVGFLGGIKQAAVGALGTAAKIGSLGLAGGKLKFQADSYIKSKLIPAIEQAEVVAASLLEFSGKQDDVQMQANWKKLRAWSKGDEEMPKIGTGSEISGAAIAAWFEMILFADASKRIAIYWKYFKEKFLGAIAPPSSQSEKSVKIRELADKAEDATDKIFGVFAKMEDIRNAYKGRSDKSGMLPRAAVAQLGQFLGNQLNTLQTILDDIEDFI